MIVVTVNLVSARGPQFDEELGAMTIYNDGTDRRDMTGNYIVMTHRKGSDAVQRANVVQGYRRREQNIWNLVAQALEAMDYGEQT